MKLIYLGICLSISVLLSCSNESDDNKEPVIKENKKSSSELKEKKNIADEDTLIDSKEGDELRSESPEKFDDNKKENTDTSLWDEYRMAKANAEAALEKGNIDIVTSELLLAVKYAKELNRPEIAAWQLNNIGYYSIREFRKRTDYDNRMSQLEKMKYGEEKAKYLEETKVIIEDNFQLLRNALIHLNRALELSNKLDDKEKENRTEKINRNIIFINWLEKFIDTDSQ